MEISDTKEFVKLADIEASIDECTRAWESIVKRNNDVSGGVSFKTQLSNYKTLSQLLADYTAIKATLSILEFKVDNDYIAWLRKKGYKIVTNVGATVEERTANYIESITAALRRSENIITKIKMRQNELEADAKSIVSDESIAGFEEIMANLSMSLGFEVNDNVTLARYNELIKLLKKRNKAQAKK